MLVRSIALRHVNIRNSRVLEQWIKIITPTAGLVRL
jgi:hypothetical protein